ncbi:ECF RNA polymerase sigma factor SigE [bacterium HR36]|nr:ECF RNA polymerase sigma factor SigE [bacterium HR36]
MTPPGDRAWAEQIVAQHYQGLYRYAYRLSGSATEAEDLTQEAFVKALSHSQQLRDAERTRAWLYSILRHEYLQRCRAEQQRGRAVALDETVVVPEPDEEPPAYVDAELLQRGLLLLPEEFRTPLILAYWEDFRYQDIAELMGIPVGTVMSRLWRAKQWLRRWLTNSGTEPFVTWAEVASADGNTEVSSRPSREAAVRRQDYAL